MGVYEVRELKPYWQSLLSAFSKIDINLEQGGLAYNWLYGADGIGVNPQTGFSATLKIELPSYGADIKKAGNQVVVFYCPETFSSEENIGYWISTNSGRSWMIVSDEEIFLKIIDKVDVMI